MGNHEIVITAVSVEEKEGLLTYYLLTDTIAHENAYLPVYGVSVVLQLGERLEHCKIHNVTNDRDKMLQFIRRMAEGTVFPMTLRDIIEDFVA